MRTFPIVGLLFSQSGESDTWRYDQLIILFLQREIASKGGKASSGSFEKGSERAREAGRKGGSVSTRSGTKNNEDDE